MQGTEIAGLFDVVKSSGPVGILTAYLIYKDLYKPWRNGKNGKSNSNGKTTFASEADVTQLGISFREHRTKAEENFTEIRERLVRVETLLEPEGHGHLRP